MEMRLCAEDRGTEARSWHNLPCPWIGTNSFSNKWVVRSQLSITKFLMPLPQGLVQCGMLKNCVQRERSQTNFGIP
jgi:hypothetical protein